MPRIRRTARRSKAETRRHNIREIAAAANVSVATVSRTLQTPDVVAPETRERVRKTIARFGYTPNLQARILRTARTQLVVALVPDISNPFFAEVIRGIEKVAHEHGYSVLLGDTQHSKLREQKYADLLGTRQADGLITLLPHIPKITLPPPLPIVNACEYVKDRQITSVHVDNVAAARVATEYLLDLGHERIGFVTGPMKSPISIDRDRGYQEALQGAGIARDPALTANGDFSFESGMAAGERLLDANRWMTAVFCSNDEMAIGVIRAARGRGLQVPRDLSVVGFDDIHLARHYDPPLTTIAQPMGDLGSEAMSRLIEILNGTAGRPRKQVLPTQLVVRSSTLSPVSTRLLRRAQ